MWTTEYTATTTLGSDRVWRAIEALHRGELSYPGSDAFALRGPFAVGTEIEVTPARQDTFRSTITELEPGVVYADRTSFDGVTLLFRHTLVATENGTTVTHRLEIDGPAADEVGPELGPQIGGDFAESMAALLDAAGRLDATAR